MTDFETMVEMFTRAGLNFYHSTNSEEGYSVVGTYDNGREFVFDENGNLTDF